MGSRLFTASAATGLLFLAGSSVAAPPSGVTSLVTGISAVGQAGPQAGTEDPRRTVIAILGDARGAMDRGDWQKAESLIARAESMNVHLGLFHTGDTPAKLRGELVRRRGESSSPLPSQRYSSSTGQVPTQGSQAIPSGSLPGQGLGGSPMAQAPGGAKAFPEQSPFGGMASNAPPAAGGGTNPNRMTSDSLLLAARQALAVGDSRKASALVSQAKSMGVAYDYADDSPQRLEALIAKHESVTQQARGGQNPSAERRAMAELYMEQAEWLIKWQAFDEAERLAGEAGRLDVAYNPFETTPNTLLTKIAAMRKSSSEPARFDTSGPAGSGAPSITRLPEAGNTPQQSEMKPTVMALVAQARAALANGDLARAEQLAQYGASYKIPDSSFAPQEDRPELVLLDIERRRGGQIVQASGVAPIGTAPGQGGVYAGNQAVYDPQFDPTQNVTASATAPQQGNMPEGMRLYLQGEQALMEHQVEQALYLFQQASNRRNELDPQQQQRLQDRLVYLTNAQVVQPQSGPNPLPPGQMIDEAAAAQQMLARQISAQVAEKEYAARVLQTSDPQAARRTWDEAREIVERSGLPTETRTILLRRVTRGLTELDAFVAANRPQIELIQSNQAVQESIDRERTHKVEVQQELAYLVDEFNQLMEERRFAEAELVARRAAELNPDELVVLQLQQQAKFSRTLANEMDLRERKADGFYAALDSVGRASTPFDDRFPIVFPDAKTWEDMTGRRRRLLEEQGSVFSEKESEIQRRLDTPVSLKFRDAPLSAVMENLGRIAQVNVHLDPRGLAEEGVTTDTPITIDLANEISLKSALNLILQPLRLSYVVKNEVLEITSEQLRDGEVYPMTYNVADLVTPIPNFSPNGTMGISGALQDAYNRLPQFGSGGGLGAPSPWTNVASTDGAMAPGMVDPSVLAQVNNLPQGFVPGIVPGLGGGGVQTGASQPINFGGGPGGLGGGLEPDFDALIELITTTVEPTSWDEVGGPGSVKEFEGNLSLVISQTQEVHEQIADLLEQLRRLQDLQVTIEVRFITLNDNFFERIGIDFDFDINDNIDAPFQIFGRPDPNFTPNFGGAGGGAGGDINPGRDVQDRDAGQSVTVGMAAPGVFSADLDIPFQQGSFGLAVPQFGGFNPGAGATLGFAILSDLEAFFFIEAAQGDRRSNVLQAPKVTLFNGQQATILDQTQSPFVVSVIPVVGDFAAAQQPVIMVLPEGTMLTVQAVVSSDRRFVRLTVVPFFSTIGEVNTFTFAGETSTTTESDSQGPDDATTGRSNTETTITSGTTVQQPSVAFVSVQTTVSVPDGGTVLLGGIKRLSEGRNQAGVPMLNKLPYVNRLFSNVAIGRETQSLMLMVTPRIIIQEEEEEFLGVQTTP